MKINWAIAHEKLESNPAEPKLSDAIKRAGHGLFLSSYSNRKYDEIPYSNEECVIMHGPIQFINRNNKGYTPGAFGFKKETDVSFYMSHVENKHFLNYDAIFMPWGLIKQNPEFIISHFNGDVFIRPNSGFKSFQGFILNRDTIKDDIFSNEVLQNIQNEEMCVVSSKKNITFEFRFVVCNNEVITGSQYMWEDRKDVRTDVLPHAREIANIVAKHKWQLDSVYTVDIAVEDGDQPSIIEFNSFSSAGLYYCDRDIIVDCVSKAALKEWGK